MENGVSLELLADYFQNPANFDTDPNPDDLPADQTKPLRVPSLTTTDCASTTVSAEGLSPTERLLLLERELAVSKENEANLRAQVAQLQRSATTVSPTPRRPSLSVTKSAPMRKQIASGALKDSQPLTRRRSLAGKGNTAVTSLPREQKQAITSIVHQYLVQSGNKETANTFADEAGDPDFDDWQLVGLAQEPPPLHLIFKQFCKATTSRKTSAANMSPSPSVLDMPEMLKNSDNSIRAKEGTAEAHDRSTGTEIALTDSATSKNRSNPGQPKSMAYKAELNAMDEGLPMRRVKSETRFMSVEQELTLDIEHLRRGYEAVKQTNGHLRARNEELQSMVDRGLANKGAACIRTASEREEEENMSLERMYSVNTLRQRPLAYRKAIETVSLYGAGKDRLSLEVIHIKKHNDDPVDVLGWCLPNIIPHVLVKRRDELIPALIITIQRHRTPKVRDQLTNILFNLVRKPTDNQRRAIVNGCSVLAERIGPLRVEAELLPQCWEQINHPHAERRILVADTCGKLARYVKPELRGSLVVSILTQLMEDTSDMVRQSAVKNMGLVVTYLEGKDKHTNLTKLLISAILDRNDRVVRAAEALYLPSMAQWACELDLFTTSFLPTLCTSLESAMGKMIELAPQPNAVFGGNQYKQRQARQQQTPHNLEAARQTKNVLMHIEVMCLLVPFLYAYLLRASPFGSLVQDECASAPVGRAGSFSLSGTKDTKDRATNGAAAEGLAASVLEDEAFNDALGAEPSWLDAMEDDDFWKDMDVVDEEKVDDDSQDEGMVLTRQPSYTKHAENLLFATSTLLGSDSTQARLQLKLDEHVSRNQIYRPGDDLTNWPAFTWMKEEWLSNLVSLVSVCPLENESATFALSRLVFLTCVTFGEVYTRTLVQPLYVKMLALQPNEAKTADTTAAEVRSVRARVVVAYLCGVLRASSLKDQRRRLLSEFQRLMNDIATNKNGWTTDDYPLLEIVVRMLCKSDESLITDVVSLMWDMIVSPDAAIRATSPYLVQGLLLCCDVATLRDRVLPAVITLSSDENMDVRVSAIPVFGHILESVNDKGVQDKIKMQLQSLLESDDAHALRLMHEVLSMLANIMPTIESTFRDDFIIPSLYNISCRTHQHANDEGRVSRLVALLVKTVVAAMQSDLPQMVLQKYIQPTCDTLQLLPRTCVRVEDEETLAEITVECTERLSAANVAAQAISESLTTTKQKFRNFFNKNDEDEIETNGMENMHRAAKSATPPPTNAFTNLFKNRG